MAEFLTGFSNILWGAPVLILLGIVGLLYGIRTKFFQIRKMGYILKNTAGEMFKKGGGASGNKGTLTPLQAVCSALAGCVGTANIAGVATAMVIGGPGAVFWMWVIALLGMMTKCVEVTLGQYYRIQGKDGVYYGGPMYYIERGMGMKWRWLAKIFAFFGMCVGLFGIGTFTQVNSISSAITGFFDPEKNATVSILGMDYSIFTVIGSIVLAVLVGLVVIGGLKRIAKVSERVIPAMVVLYVGLSVLLIVTNLDKIPGAFVTIFESAFGLQAAAGGMLGAIIIAMQKGIARGIFSNEAGLGSAPIAAAAAQTKEPVRQGLVSMTGTFWDTVVICALTGIVLVSTMLANPDIASDILANPTVYSGAMLASEAFSKIPYIGTPILVLGMVAFSYTTILGWSYYGNRCITYLFGRYAIRPYQVVYVAVAFLGAIGVGDIVWTISDIGNALMAIPNIVVVLLLSGMIARETRHYVYDGNLDEPDDAPIPQLEGK